ncbi:MAG: phytanoyl-CoA dioxygenase family protein [Acidimicrobiales bacterium]|nr:phytanoyl-CoA dioxygenase family protein [Acidimicrobiales bacterium]
MDVVDPDTSLLATGFHTDGFAVVDRLVSPELIDPLRERFERLFRGGFETGVPPDEINWQEGLADPTLTRQICNAWKADRLVATVVLSARLGESLARLAGWPGARIIQDNLLWKPPGARSVGFHRDNAYLAWYRPQQMATCWIALDQTSSETGTVSFVQGSHRWATDGDPAMEFHAPADYRAPMEEAAAAEGVRPEIVPVEVPAGGGSFHHGWTWHGSDVNRSNVHRRVLVLHCASSEARFHRPGFGVGNGPIYSRYAHSDDDVMDEAHFPVLWTASGHRTSGLDSLTDPL